MHTFRFHTGSIKSSYVDSMKPKSEGFRFHTGSIKRLIRVEGEAISGKGFDSILVRLKVIYGNTMKYPVISFDSILVRLKGMRTYLRNILR